MIKKIRTTNREEWLAERKKSLGGSDMGAVLGMSPYASPLSVWMDKTGKTPDKEPSEWMRLGTDLEDYVAQRFSEKSGLKVINDTATWRNDKYPHLHANIDRKVVGQKSGVECKMISTLNEKKYRDGSFPDNYYVQCVHYLAVSEYDRWYLAVLIYGFGLRIYLMTRIENDVKPEWCDSMVYVEDGEVEALANTGEDFWQKYVATNTTPPVDGHSATSDALNALYPQSDDTSCDLSGYSSDLMLYVTTQKEIKRLEEQKDAIANRIKGYMTTSSRGKTDSFSVSWTTSERSTFDSKSFAKDHQDMDLSSYYKTTTIRTFKITEKKENK